MIFGFNLLKPPVQLSLNMISIQKINSLEHRLLTTLRQKISLKGKKILVFNLVSKYID